jgi:phosphotriesterase-related protein
MKGIWYHGLACILLCIVSGAVQGAEEKNMNTIMTVNGPIASGELGMTLPHEHVIVDFVDAAHFSPDRYDADEVFEVTLPYLKEVYALGGRAFVDCTPAYLAKDPKLLQRLSAASGLHILTNTGYYGAAGDKHVPAHAYAETADELAARWIKEWKEGIEDTGIRPGFIKTAVDNGPLSDIDRKLVQAAAKTHLATGLTIASHTTDGIAFMEELDILEQEGVHGGALIWVHAHVESDKSYHIRAAKKGAWIEFDYVHPDTLGSHVDLISHMMEQGFLNQVLASHDAGWYTVGEAKGGEFRGFSTLFKELIPTLEEAGCTTKDIEDLCVKNPQEAFSIRVRPASP